MKKALSIPLLCLALSGLGSCSDFLDRDPDGIMTPGDIRLEKDILNALNGTYRALILDRNQPFCQDFMGDDAYCNDPGYGELLIWKMEQTPSDMKYTLDKWSRNYEGILRANTVIAYAPGVHFDDASLRARYIAEALVLRAYFYADLIDFYGDVPFRTEPEGLKKRISPRVDRQNVMMNILMDLDNAVGDLPKTYRNPADHGRVTQGAALALKARICLYNKRWDWAVEACREVIGLGVYDLHPSYRELFTPAVEKTNKEYILTQQYVAGKDSEGLSGIFWTKLSAYGAFQIAHNLVEEYRMTDGRRYDDPLSGYTDTAPYANRDPRLLYTVKVDAVADMSGTSHTGYKAQKFVDDAANPDKIHRNDEVDFPLIRYADVLLMLAEALVEKGEYDYDEVTGLVDRIRQRGDVRMPTVAEAEERFAGRRLTREELREAIRHERRVEFPLEGLRYSDIRRWEIGPEALGDCYAIRKVTDDTDPDDITTRYEKVLFMKRTFNAAKGYLWPVPAIEIQTNPMPQNPGY